METRKGKLIINKSGGNASGNSNTYRVTLPNKWVNSLMLGDDNRDLLLSFDGNSIIITPIFTVEQYIEKYKSNKLIKLLYYNDNELCTTIIADYAYKKIVFENHNNNPIYRAFGENETPNWSDYEHFLKERCVPQSRDGLKAYLNSLRLDEYDPLEIIKKTKGKMAEDNQYLEVEIL